MTTIEEMDEFVNWDNNPDVAALGLGADLLLQPPALEQPPVSLDPSLDMHLVLENVDEDDFSFFALQHFAGELDGISQQPGHDVSLHQIDCTECWETPDSPCRHCSRGGFSCKRIQEGRYKGYCTSCVALGCECSFAPGSLPDVSSSLFDRPSSAGLPVNPWPLIGNHPNRIPHEDLLFGNLDNSNSASVTDLPSMAADSLGNGRISPLPKASPAPKVGARFSRESVRILKNWLSSHTRHPYPSDEEKEMLQRQTGLNKTQITNWLANARRRGKIVAPRSTSPHVSSWSTMPIDIPQRRGTPALEKMSSRNPLERWVDSPPEHEPASVTAIARAINATASGTSSGLASPFSYNYTDDGSGRSLCNQSSTSSLGTSHSSGGSFASAYSHGSRGSFGSFSSLNRGRRRRRRRATTKQAGEEKSTLTAPLKTFQCTFCTETFRTKHDWQRHEKSLHLSLERWVCSPEGPRMLNPTTNQVSCVFCGEVNPDDAHIESHNFSSCQEKTLEERTFYRKDHLNQHLKLVHNVKFLDWAMKTWKVATPEIRSRCGFCGIVMDTWTIRVDHLAEHFKTGNTMADWKGDWGFEAPVLDMVENSIPPYLIHDERNTPMPYSANRSPTESPRSAYELIKMELVFYATNLKETTGSFPNDEELQREACRIIFASEVLSLREISSTDSWLRDLIMSSDLLAQQAKFGPLRRATENRLSILKINGKDNLFEACPLEQQLREFVDARRFLGLTATDLELQKEACRAVGRLEETSTYPSDGVANWLVRTANASTGWLAAFRRRAHLPRTDDMGNERLRSRDPTTIDSTIHNYSRLERELGDYVTEQRSLGLEPTDADLQRRARVIIYEFDDGWNQTAADNEEWLLNFKSRHGLAGGLPTLATSPTTTMSSAKVASNSISDAVTSSSLLQTTPSEFPGKTSFGGACKNSVFFFNDPNCYRRLALDLRRYVTQCTSPNNPNQHVPTDEELRHQARWILYDDDDPWNQTAADNAEWLLRFKRDVGIAENGPGLDPKHHWTGPRLSTAETAMQGLHVPETKLANAAETVVEAARCAPTSRRESRSADATQRPRAGTVIFCSRQLEPGLFDFVERQMVATGGEFPSDDMLRAKAREILGTESTAADDLELLQKFKAWAMVRLTQSPKQGGSGTSSSSTWQSVPALDVTMGNQEAILPSDMDLNMTNEDINDILQDMNFEFEAEDLGDGGASLML